MHTHISQTNESTYIAHMLCTCAGQAAEQFMFWFLCFITVTTPEQNTSFACKSVYTGATCYIYYSEVRLTHSSAKALQ